jgi:hypothetical protein
VHQHDAIAATPDLAVRPQSELLLEPDRCDVPRQGEADDRVEGERAEEVVAARDRRLRREAPAPVPARETPADLGRRRDLREDSRESEAAEADDLAAVLALERPAAEASFQC